MKPRFLTPAQRSPKFSIQIPAYMVNASTAAVAMLDAKEERTFVPSTKYATTRLVGWTVRVNRERLTTQSELGSNALQLLSLKLREITNAVPPRACEALRKVPISARRVVIRASPI